MSETPDPNDVVGALDQLSRAEAENAALRETLDHLRHELDTHEALERALAQERLANDELRQQIKTAVFRGPMIGIPETRHAPVSPDPVPVLPLPNQEEAAQRARDLEDAAKQTRARARRAEQSLAYEPPQLKLEIFAPDQTGGVGWNLSIVGSAERVDRGLLLIETLLPAYDHFMALMQDQGGGKRHRERLAR
ncbi:MAG TPA: hypothetical protein VFL91_21365 [Thermomicrobiales bacterium]|nr:hypothetical protein [Thermomicrobiales bacterium]